MFLEHRKHERTVWMSSQKKRRGETRSKNDKKHKRIYELVIEAGFIHGCQYAHHHSCSLKLYAYNVGRVSTHSHGPHTRFDKQTSFLYNPNPA
ncbi:hypothetical protein HanRHA438_Chr17g0798651 [Helianthus annuus]|nr:hypothetical protein HanRHA438_Chr17g0798651 [Helianthus annuus]